MHLAKSKKAPSSFRDPSGFVFKDGANVYRQINFEYKDNYDLLIKSGLYDFLVKEKLLVAHKEIKNQISPESYKIIKPTRIPLISYPYEWSFSQLKDAALLTLKIQQTAVRYGMSLKDASAYNVQFLDGNPIFIDTLSFESYERNIPWVAYKQFCQHFLAPLMLMSKVDLRLGSLLSTFLDGIPLDLAVRLLPRRTFLKIGAFMHIYLHSKAQDNYSDRKILQKKSVRITTNQHLSIIDSLFRYIKSLKLPKQKTQWGEYYGNTNYSEAGGGSKSKIIDAWVEKIRPKNVWDVGANEGLFSRITSAKNIPTLATDIDPIAVEKAYLRMKSSNDKYLTPLIIDITNPSPSIGWGNRERGDFLSRDKFDLTMCLALVHHLAIGNNLPFEMIAELFSKQTKYLIIEFVPAEDSNSARLLMNRKNIFSCYNVKDFEDVFSRYFRIEDKYKIRDSKRTLYLMKTR